MILYGDIMIKEGQIVRLDNGKDYIVLKIMSVHNLKYLYLITLKKPLEVLIATEKIVNGKSELNEIKDNNELEYALTCLTSYDN